MPNIPYRAFNLDNKLPAPGGMITASWAKILWSAATVGKRTKQDLDKKQPYARYQSISKIYRIKAGLLTKGDLIVKTPFYNRMSTQEKHDFQGELGETTAKVVADKLFDTPWLMHLSLYQEDLKVTFDPDNNKRPDLIGLNRSREWIIVEAKGSGEILSRKTLQEAKVQTQSISTINGKKPTLRLVVGAQFDKKGELELALYDPDDLDRVPGIEIDMNVFFRSYYQPILDILAPGERPRQFIGIEDRRFDVVELTELDIQLGLDSELIALLERRESAAEQILAYLPTVPTTSIRPREINRIPIEIASDGIIVIPGPQWSDSARSTDKFDENKKFEE